MPDNRQGLDYNVNNIVISKKKVVAANMMNLCNIKKKKFILK